MKGQDRSCPPVEGEAVKLEMAKEGATREGAISIICRVCKTKNRCNFSHHYIKNAIKELTQKNTAFKTDDLLAVLPAFSLTY